jgi:Fe-S cluster biogenesis protein NfuA
MNIDGVKSVFYGADFITVTKATDVNWAHIKPEVFSLITEAVTSGAQIVNITENKSGESGQDGGDIEFRGFEDGHVLLKLRGACRTCDSSTVTLKNGIEGMLMHYVSAI